MNIPSSILIKGGMRITQEVKRQVEAAAAEIRRRMQEENFPQPLELKVFETSEVSGNLTMEEFIRQTAPQDYDRIALERNPSKLCKDISYRLLDDIQKFNQQNWEKASEDGKLYILRDMLKIFAEELELPDEVKQRLTIETENMEDALGATNIFVELDRDGKLIFNPEIDPIISLNPSLLSENSSMFDAMETLFHESLHVMQESCSVETGNTILESAHKQLWTDEIREVCRTNAENLANQSLEDYITSEMEVYAHAYDDYLKDVYMACFETKYQDLFR